MKTFAITSVIALATVATAQFDNIPSCAVTCFVGPLTSDGCKTLTDFACHCKQGAKLLSSVQPCVQGACSADDQKTTIEAVEKVCADAGAPIEIPDTSAAPSSAAPVTTIVDPSAASSSTPATTIVDPSAASSAVESVASSLSSAMSSAASQASSQIASITSAAGNATASKTASSTLSEFTGAAAQATQAVGVLGAAALALLAL